MMGSFFKEASYNDELCSDKESYAAKYMKDREAIAQYEVYNPNLSQPSGSHEVQSLVGIVILLHRVIISSRPSPFSEMQRTCQQITH